MHGPLSEHARGDCRANRRAWTAAAQRQEIHRQISRSHSVRHRCQSEWKGHATATVQRSNVRNLLPLPRNRRRILRLRAFTRAAAGALAHLWSRFAGPNSEEGLLRKRRAAAADQHIAQAAQICREDIRDRRKSPICKRCQTEEQSDEVELHRKDGGNKGHHAYAAKYNQGLARGAQRPTSPY